MLCQPESKYTIYCRCTSIETTPGQPRFSYGAVSARAEVIGEFWGQNDLTDIKILSAPSPSKLSLATTDSNPIT